VPLGEVAQQTLGEVIVILAPTGQDAALIASVLRVDAHACRIVKDIEGACELLNAGMAAVLVIAEEALTSQGIVRLNEQLAKQHPWSDIPVILLTSSGETTLATLRVTKAFSPAGNLNLLERPFRKITLQSVVQVALRARRKQHDVRELLEKHATAAKMRDEFISIASHELKTPITSLKLQTQLNQRKMASGDASFFDPVRTQRLVDSTAKQLDRLAHLVEDMLDISRINIGRLRIKPEAFDLAKLLSEAVERIMPQLDAAGCTVSFRSDQPVMGEWDRYRIEQVVNNLLSNAIRYCPGKPIEVAVRQESGFAAFSIRDHGIGIAPENQKRIFERFERAVSRHDISGLGLGLYICREIVEAHNGSIEVESEVGQGSRFTVRLPTVRL
jgi:signal transduction histidine kinase